MPLPEKDNILSNVEVIRNNWIEGNEIERNNNECIICLDDETSNDLTLPCMHRFHKKCVEKWYLQSKNLWCPLCKNPFSKELITSKKTIKYNNNVQLNDSNRLIMHLTNQELRIPVAPLNTPPRIARFRRTNNRVMST